jgi:hypothetical protein
MPADRIELAELRLRIPGVDARQGREIMEAALKHASRQVEVGRSVRLRELKLRLEIPEGTPINKLAEVIGDRVAMALCEVSR